MANEVTAIQQIAIKSRIKISCPTFAKTDQKVTKSTNANYGAKSEAGSYRKKLITKAHLKPITDVVSASRAYHKENTLPWGQNGDRMLPADSVIDFSAQMRKFRDEFDIAVAEFKLKYPSLIQDEQHTLGTMYNATEYPSLAQLETKFQFNHSLVPIENVNDIRISLSETMVERIKDDYRVEEAKNREAFTTDLFNRIKDVIGGENGLISRITATNKDSDTGEVKYKKFTSSAITNVKELAKILGRLNLNNDPGLEEIRKEIENKLGDIDAGQIKHDVLVRKRVAKQGEDILKKVESKMAFYTNPGAKAA